MAPWTATPAPRRDDSHRTKERTMDRRMLTLSLGIVLATLLFSLTSRAAMAAAPASYAFTPVAFLGDAAPGGGHFMNDFEPTRMNSSGDLAFTADLSDQQQEGVFLASGGKILPIVRYGQPAPGGGTFGAAEAGNLGLNDAGDMAVVFNLEPYPTSPFGLSSGLYRWSHTTQTLTPVVVSLVTPAPGAP